MDDVGTTFCASSSATVMFNNLVVIKFKNIVKLFGKRLMLTNNYLLHVGVLVLILAV